MINQLILAVLVALAVTTEAETKSPSRDIGLIYPPENVELQVGEVTGLGVAEDDTRIIGIRRNVTTYLRYPNGTENTLFGTWDDCDGMGIFAGGGTYVDVRLDTPGKYV